MSVKLALLKSGETLISDMKEVVADVNQDKPTAFLFENPHLVDTKKKEGGKFDVILSPWLVLSKDTSMVVPTDWVVTIVDPHDSVVEMYIDKAKVLKLEEQEDGD